MLHLRPRHSVLALAALVTACAEHSGDVASVVIGSPPKFETRLEVSTGTGTHSDFHVADLDGDTILDMAVVSLTGEMRILIGNGTTFVSGQELQLGGLPIWIAGADLDDDGDRDLVVVRNTGNSTDVWLNDGNGTFTAGQSLPVGQDALAVVIGDADNDGFLDVLVSRPVAPEIVVFLGTGGAAFVPGPTVTLPGGGSAFNLQLGDVTRDGYEDLIVSDPWISRVLVYPGNQGGKDFGLFAYELYMSGSPRAVSVGDLSGDGLPDMAVSTFDSTRFVVVTEIDPGYPEVVGGGTPYLSFDIEVPGAPSVSTIADVTGDGLVDLVACLGGNASMVVAPQVPGGGVGEQFQLDATGLPLRPFVGDFDQNGKNDLFALSGLGDRVNLWLSQASGALLGARSYGSGLPGAAWIAGGDFDGDGDEEIAVGSYQSGSISLLARRADGWLVPEHSLDLGQVVFQVTTADLDGDGRPDLIASIAGGLKLLRNQSSAGNYDLQILPGSPTSAIGSGVSPFAVAVVDFDRDGDLDIAVSDFFGGSLHVVPGTPVPFEFGTETVINLPGGPAGVAAADFTGDGWIDLAVSRAGMADIAVLQNDGAGNFAETMSLPVGQAPNYLLTADFDRDGRADLVVSNGSSGTITVLFGGASGFSGKSYPAGASPTALLADDLTGDGLPDILVTSLSSGDFRVLTGDGRGSFPDLARFPGTFGASDAVLQDMDADGRADLIIASVVTNRVSLVRNIRED